ncbi:DUF1638 domain-containing protein [Algimonas porphyrae]|uniref:DUF1638 domain-containing protein n=1 Tax=Algimonas porphyrae TaxID=1128113 RepID=A0ABQ5UZV9_9PROT|nr:DUF1638 domain-containing protein [Algimonas porphyrae]GLQ19925.1 hypothetical protein GCM10007854_08800 [Algimonas porphyrae]
MKTLILACGALAREIPALSDQLPAYDLRCVPAILHNRPDRIVPAIEALLDATAGQYARTVIAFGDCGTGGGLDRLCSERGLERLPGAHCYAFFAGRPEFDAMMEEELGTFFLTDFLARQFEAMVIRPLGLDRKPELRDLYFNHYTRLVYLSQSADPDLLQKAKLAADRLGLAFEHRPTGLSPFARDLARLTAPIAA